MAAMKRNRVAISTNNGESADFVAAGQYDFSLVDSDDAVNRMRQGRAAGSVDWVFLCHDNGQWISGPYCRPLPGHDNRYVDAGGNFMDDSQHHDKKENQIKIVNMEFVSKIYNGAKALDNVSLEITKGERIVIPGPSG